MLTACNNQTKTSPKDEQQTSETASKSEADGAMEAGNSKNAVLATKANGTNEQSASNPAAGNLNDAASPGPASGETTANAGKEKSADVNSNATSRVAATGLNANDKTSQETANPHDQAGRGAAPSSGPSIQALTENGEKTLVYVGTFAQWVRDGEQFDGSYDKEHGLFVVCQSNRCQKVPISQIVFPQSGSCDVAVEDRIKLFRIKKDGTIKPEGERIKLSGTKGIIQAGHVARIIQFDPVTVTRIKKATMIKSNFSPVDEPAKLKEVKPIEPGLRKKPVEPVKKNPEIFTPKAAAITDKTQTIVEKKIENPVLISPKANPPIRVQMAPANPSKIAKEVTPQVSPLKEAGAQRAIEPGIIKQQPIIRKMVTPDTIKQLNKTRMIQESRPAFRLKVKT